MHPDEPRGRVDDHARRSLRLGCDGASRWVHALFDNVAPEADDVAIERRKIVDDRYAIPDPPRARWCVRLSGGRDRQAVLVERERPREFFATDLRMHAALGT